ncbi:MAG: rhomboid family intramembrane serine protease [Bdellovibrionales bacterium]|nr:rhomboid family intramembrane serine protease [Bdellovibrionales bacterium]
MNQQFQMSVPLTPVVKKLIIINLVLWIGGVLILQGMILGGDSLFRYFALTPHTVITEYWVWQFFTYMFLHSNGVFHVLFNMLALWWFGAELEQRWGPRFFLTYYITCGAGAGVIYVVGALIYYLSTGNITSMMAPLVGASGATYGLLLAYALLFGERQIYFMMLFPMKAKYFAIIIGAVEMVTLLDSGMGSQTANLAHLGGIVVGFLFLTIVARMRERARSPNASKRGRKLKLVVNNDRKPPGDEGGPKYWN